MQPADMHLCSPEQEWLLIRFRSMNTRNRSKSFCDEKGVRAERRRDKKSDEVSRDDFND